MFCPLIFQFGNIKDILNNCPFFEQIKLDSIQVKIRTSKFTKFTKYIINGVNTYIQFSLTQSVQRYNLLSNIFIILILIFSATWNLSFSEI